MNIKSWYLRDKKNVTQSFSKNQLLFTNLDGHL